MKNSKIIMMVCAMVAVLAFEACKRVVDVESLKKSFTASVVAEQMESGNTLTVDTIFLNQTTGDNFKGELRGHINDSTEVVYDLDVADEGKELTLEWNLRECLNEYAEESSFTKTTIQKESTSDLEGTTWSYFKNEDDLTHNVISFNANIMSTNSIPIDSYGNSARLVISIFYSQSGNNVSLFFKVDGGFARFASSFGSGFLAVFDDSDVDETWSLVNMVPSRKSLYFTSDKAIKFINRLKETKQARIQVNIDDVGKKTFDFNVKGLQWDFD